METAEYHQLALYWVWLIFGLRNSWATLDWRNIQWPTMAQPSGYSDNIFYYVHCLRNHYFLLLLYQQIPKVSLIFFNQLSYFSTGKRWKVHNPWGFTSNCSDRFSIRLDLHYILEINFDCLVIRSSFHSLLSCRMLAVTSCFWYDWNLSQLSHEIVQWPMKMKVKFELYWQLFYQLISAHCSLRHNIHSSLNNRSPRMCHSSLGRPIVAPTIDYRVSVRILHFHLCIQPSQAFVAHSHRALQMHSDYQRDSSQISPS